MTSKILINPRVFIVWIKKKKKRRGNKNSQRMAKNRGFARWDDPITRTKRRGGKEMWIRLAFA